MPTGNGSAIEHRAASTQDTPRSRGAIADVEEWKLLEPEEIFGELRREYSEKRRFKAQTKLDKAVREHFEDLTERWKSEMDTLLVYAGLFSAVLTAFNVESYRLLRPDPMTEAVIALRQLTQQLDPSTAGLSRRGDVSAAAGLSSSAWLLHLSHFLSSSGSTRSHPVYQEPRERALSSDNIVWTA
ncbi:hypothetical protein C8Q77DRAFT_200537 [Trametes polyzona]|nr:hypothetical protein C8Q77DRAFT_200537 [Trametes polyzona]